MPAKLSQETVLALLAEKNWEPVDGWEYADGKTPIPGRCLVCGYEGPGPRYDSLKRNRGACKECGKPKLSEETVRALLAEKNWEPVDGWDYVDVRTPIPGRCLVEGCGYEGPGPKYNNLQQGRGACKNCSVGNGKLDEETALALLKEKDWEPVEGWEYINAYTPIPGRCLVEGCGYESPTDKGPNYSNLKMERGACQSCSKSGYDPAKPGVFYRFTFVEHGERFQVYGITNNWEERQKTYERELKNKTWKMSDIQTLRFEDGKIPQQIESDFNKIRTPLLEDVLPSQSCIEGTVKESFSLSPDSLELITVFEAHWADAVTQQAYLEAKAA